MGMSVGSSKRNNGVWCVLAAGLLMAVAADAVKGVEEPRVALAAKGQTETPESSSVLHHEGEDAPIKLVSTHISLINNLPSEQISL